MTLIRVIGSRTDLVNHQKMCIDEVNRHPDNEKLNQEVLRDFNKWTNESKIFRNNNPKGMKWITSFDIRKNKQGKREIVETLPDKE